MSFVDLTGMKFGRLTVIERAESYVLPSSGKKRSQWLCECECGNRCVVQAGHLKSGHTQSCGCLNRDIVKERATHGESKTPLYFVWKSMRQRCKNPNNRRYRDYGGRGIDICKEWDEFLNFKDWALKNGYKEGLTIDRINNDLGYSPSNNGKTQTQKQWAEELGINYGTLENRLYTYGWDVEKSFNEPIRGR